MRFTIPFLCAAAVLGCSAEATASDEGYAVAAYVLITGGGITSAVASQISLIQGRPSSDWGYTALGFAGANALTAGIFLAVAGLSDDESDQIGFGIAAGAQMSIAVAALVSGAHAVANHESRVEPQPQPQPQQFSLSIRF